MKVELPNWISSLSGFNNGIVFYGYKSKYGICYSRDYVYPTLTAANTTFGIEGKAVAQTTWTIAAAGFVANMQTYADAWNLTQQEGRELCRDLTALNLFMKAVYIVADLNSFDLAQLTVAKFGSGVGYLLGTAHPNVYQLILQSGMPACGLDLTLLNVDIL